MTLNDRIQRDIVIANKEANQVYDELKQYLDSPIVIQLVDRYAKAIRERTEASLALKLVHTLGY